jgi:hypothetical protein
MNYVKKMLGFEVGTCLYTAELFLGEGLQLIVFLIFRDILLSLYQMPLCIPTPNIGSNNSQRILQTMKCTTTPENRSVQTVQRSIGVVVHFRVCKILKMCTSKKNTLILKIGCQGDKRAK